MGHTTAGNRLFVKPRHRCSLGQVRGGRRVRGWGACAVAACCTAPDASAASIVERTASPEPEATDAPDAPVPISARMRAAQAAEAEMAARVGRSHGATQLPRSLGARAVTVYSFQLP